VYGLNFPPASAGFLLAYSSILKMEDIYSCEITTSLRITRRHSPEESALHIYMI
jgi:hypothetical protein